MDSKLHEVTKNFVTELQLAAEGKETSLPYIHNLLPREIHISDNEEFQVFVIGGSVFRKARVKKNGEKLEILAETMLEQPLFTTREVLFSFLEEQLDTDVTKLCCNFAYPLKTNFRDDILDGILIGGSKEHVFAGLVGKSVGKEFADYILEKRSQKLTVSVANDTVCMLLSGLIDYDALDIACGIVGTGLNFAFFGADRDVINLESANFNNYEVSPAVQFVDQNSQNPGAHLFEKEAAGAYLYRQFNYLIQKTDANFTPLTSTKHLNEVALSGDSEASKLAQDLLKHSAEFTACQVSGIMLHKKKSLTFIMIGSLFWKANLYKETVMNTCMKLNPDYIPNFVEIENADVIGAAKLLA